MTKFTSKFAKTMGNMIEYREALGFSCTSLTINLSHFDRFCVENRPDCELLTKELVFDWLNLHSRNIQRNISGSASTMRQFANYLNAVGQTAYVLPDGFYPIKSTFSPYIFTDKELASLFFSID